MFSRCMGRGSGLYFLKNSFKGSRWWRGSEQFINGVIAGCYCMATVGEGFGAGFFVARALTRRKPRLDRHQDLDLVWTVHVFGSARKFWRIPPIWKYVRKSDQSSCNEKSFGYSPCSVVFCFGRLNNCPCFGKTRLQYWWFILAELRPWPVWTVDSVWL